METTNQSLRTFLILSVFMYRFRFQRLKELFGRGQLMIYTKTYQNFLAYFMEICHEFHFESIVETRRGNDIMNCRLTWRIGNFSIAIKKYVDLNDWSILYIFEFRRCGIEILSHGFKNDVGARHNFDGSMTENNWYLFDRVFEQIDIPDGFRR